MESLREYGDGLIGGAAEAEEPRAGSGEGGISPTAKGEEARRAIIEVAEREFSSSSRKSDCSKEIFIELFIEIMYVMGGSIAAAKAAVEIYYQVFHAPDYLFCISERLKEEGRASYIAGKPITYKEEEMFNKFEVAMAAAKEAAKQVIASEARCARMEVAESGDEGVVPEILPTDKKV